MNTWVIVALAGAVLWGIDYAIAEKVLQKMSVPTFIGTHLLFGFVAVGLYALWSGRVYRDYVTILAHKSLMVWFLIGISAFVIGNVLICLVIQHQDATLGSLVEISYPLFVILFSWIFFRTSHLSWSVLLGGALIVSGVFVIYFFQRV